MARLLESSPDTFLQWKQLLAAKAKSNMQQSPRFVCDDSHAIKSSKFCHPAAVLKALSLSRLDKEVDPVARQAVITVDVGDVTLVSCYRWYSCSLVLLDVYSTLLLLGVPVNTSGLRFA